MTSSTVPETQHDPGTSHPVSPEAWRQSRPLVSLGLIYLPRFSECFRTTLLCLNIIVFVFNRGDAR